MSDFTRFRVLHWLGKCTHEYTVHNDERGEKKIKNKTAENRVRVTRRWYTRTIREREERRGEERSEVDKYCALIHSLCLTPFPGQMRREVKWNYYCNHNAETRGFNCSPVRMCYVKPSQVMWCECGVVRWVVSLHCPLPCYCKSLAKGDLTKGDPTLIHTHTHIHILHTKRVTHFPHGTLFTCRKNITYLKFTLLVLFFFFFFKTNHLSHNGTNYCIL